MKLSMFALLLLAGCYDENPVKPEHAAIQFAQDLGIAIQGKPNCTQVDTDYDGYVSCTIALAGDANPPKMLQLQCAALGGRASGCKQTVQQQIIRQTSSSPE